MNIENQNTQEQEQKMIKIDTYGLLGSNFYFHKYSAHGLTKEDIESVGLLDDTVEVSENILQPLLQIDQELQKYGYKLFIKEGYRSKELYEIVYKRRLEKYGKEETDALFNMSDMPHAKGLSVDVSIVDEKTGEEIYMRSGEDGAPALFIGFYKNKTDKMSEKYQQLQDMLANVMLKNGFRIGTKREYFHFDYKPEIETNY